MRIRALNDIFMEISADGAGVRYPPKAQIYNGTFPRANILQTKAVEVEHQGRGQARIEENREAEDAAEIIAMTETIRNKEAKIAWLRPFALQSSSRMDEISSYWSNGETTRPERKHSLIFENCVCSRIIAQLLTAVTTSSLCGHRVYAVHGCLRDNPFQQHARVHRDEFWHAGLLSTHDRGRCGT
jgi:hypothetical protein